MRRGIKDGDDSHGGVCGALGVQEDLREFLDPA